MIRRLCFAIAISLAPLAILPVVGCSRSNVAPAVSTTTRYRCPMHPSVISDHPGDCPICNMRLVPFDSHDSASHESTGLAPVTITSERRQLIGVKTSEVALMPFRRTIHAFGRVEIDETRLRHIHTKVGGFVERLHAHATGELVRKGAPLLEIYSPELLAAQQEFLIALRARERTAGSPLPSVASSGDELLSAARRRLELLDLQPAQVDALAASGQAQRTVTLYAPISGTVLRRGVTEGERVTPETALMDLVDLSHVWIVASVYEHELPLVHVGQEATATLAYVPGRSFPGHVSLVYPMLDPQTRTAQVRLEFDNPVSELKPEMYADVVLTSDLGERLAVPESAVLDSGEHQVVFVDRGQGRFEPRRVALGNRAPGIVEVLSGVTAGELVLTSGNFFVDAESKLEAALAGLQDDAVASPTPGAAHSHTP